MSKIDISRYLKSKTMEELDSLTMDVSKSFLNGCTCSPLAVTSNSGVLSKAINSALENTSDDAKRALSYTQQSTAYAYKLYQNAELALNNAVTSLGGYGIYINKHGNKINIQTDFVPKAINIGIGIGESVMECVTDETKKILNNAVTKIIQFPDPKYFTSYVTTYFGKWLNSKECKEQTANIIGMSLSDFKFDDEDKKEDGEEQNSKLPEDITNSDVEDYDEKKKEDKKKQNSKLFENITYFCQNKVPEIGDWINNRTKEITEFTTMASSYAAFGKKWVCDAVDDYVENQIDIIEDWIDVKVDKILKQKQNIIEMIAKDMTDQAINYHKKLLKDAQKIISKETKLKIKNAELKAKMAVISAASKVCAKFGVPVPKFEDVISTIEKARLGEFTKKISNITNIIGQVVGNIGKPQVTDGTIEQGNNDDHSFYYDEKTGKYMIWDEKDQKYVETDTPPENEMTSVKPTTLPTAENQVKHGPDGSRWVSYKKKVKIPIGMPGKETTDYEVEIYDWTLVATVEQEKERYGETNEETNDNTQQLTGTAKALQQTNLSQTSDTSDPIQLLMTRDNISKTTADSKWKNAKKTASQMVSFNIRSAEYSPGWGKLRKNGKLKNRVIDAQARIILNIPVTDNEALNILNGHG